MSKELVISANRHETRVALVEDEQVCEVYHQRENEYSLAGSIHKGRVTRVLPGMQSAFVDIGLDRDAFLYVSDFFEDNDEYDKIVTSVEEKVLKLDKPGMAAAPPLAAPEAPEASAPPPEAAGEPAIEAGTASVSAPATLQPAGQTGLPDRGPDVYESEDLEVEAGEPEPELISEIAAEPAPEPQPELASAVEMVEEAVAVAAGPEPEPAVEAAAPVEAEPAAGDAVEIAEDVD